jgi:hypothetical protein
LRDFYLDRGNGASLRTRSARATHESRILVVGAGNVIKGTTLGFHQLPEKFIERVDFLLAGTLVERPFEFINLPLKFLPLERKADERTKLRPLEPGKQLLTPLDLSATIGTKRFIFITGAGAPVENMVHGFL